MERKEAETRNKKPPLATAKHPAEKEENKQNEPFGHAHSRAHPTHALEHSHAHPPLPPLRTFLQGPRGARAAGTRIETDSAADPVGKPNCRLPASGIDKAYLVESHFLIASLLRPRLLVVSLLLLAGLTLAPDRNRAGLV